MDGRRVVRLQKLLAEGLVRKHLRQFGKYLQVKFGRLFGYQQDEQEIDRTSVRRVESDRRFKPDKTAHRFTQSLDAPMRNGDALTETRGAQFFPGEQAVENLTPGDALIVLEQQASLFEYAFLATGLETEADV
jgi:hypothetical protein